MTKIGLFRVLPRTSITLLNVIRTWKKLMRTQREKTMRTLEARARVTTISINSTVSNNYKNTSRMMKMISLMQYVRTRILKYINKR